VSKPTVTDPAKAGAGLDSETAAALTLFNTYLAADRERQAHERQIKKAEKAKDAAARQIKRLAETGTAEEKAAAEAAYREVTNAWRKLTDPDSATEVEDKTDDDQTDDDQSDDDTDGEQDGAATEADNKNERSGESDQGDTEDSDTNSPGDADTSSPGAAADSADSDDQADSAVGSPSDESAHGDDKPDEKQAAG